MRKTDIKSRLEKLSAEDAIAFALRCVLRAMPLLMGSKNSFKKIWPEDSEKYILEICLGLNYAELLVIEKKNFVNTIPNIQDGIKHACNSIYKATAYNAKNNRDITVANVTRSVAILTTYVSVYANNHRSIIDVTNACDAASKAFGTNFVGFLKEKMASEMSDLKRLEKGENILERPLWHNYKSPIVWRTLAKKLADAFDDIGCGELFFNRQIAERSLSKINLKICNIPFKERKQGIMAAAMYLKIQEEMTPETIEFWGQSYKNFTPEMVSTVFGDGLCLIYIQPLSTRPNYYIIRVDSTVRKIIDNTDKFDEFLQNENIFDIIDEEFGYWEEDDETSEFPQLNLSCGYSFGEIE